VARALPSLQSGFAPFEQGQPSSLVPSTTTVAGVSGAVVAQICQRFATRFDLDLSGHKLAVLCGQIAHRMGHRKIASSEQYNALLDASPEEELALRDALLIGSTSFFRDEGAFVALQERLLARVLSSHSAEPVRAWVVGCSTGEEAYSLAIVLREYLDSIESSRPIRIYGTDVREQALAHARRGSYAAQRLGPLSAERLARFFVQEEPGCRAASNLRDAIIWGRHDILNDPPFSRMDIVSCRNLLVYFDRRAQAHVLRRLAYALRPSGALMLGIAESTWVEEQLFVPLEAHHRLYGRRGGALGGRGRSRRAVAGTPTAGLR
jgi:two-component system, chemotaxis family, CheB/CheR fusion protein